VLNTDRFRHVCRRRLITLNWLSLLASRQRATRAAGRMPLAACQTNTPAAPLRPGDHTQQDHSTHYTWQCESEKLQTWVFKLQTWVFKPSNLKLQSAKVKIFKLESSNLKLRKWETSNFKLRKWISSNLSLQTSNCESEKLQTSNFKLRKWETSNFKVRKWISSNLSLQTSKLRSQSWNLKLRKWKYSKLRAESFQLLSFDKLQVLKLRIRTACSKLSYQSWKLKVVESCRMLKVVECWKLKVVEYCESVEYWKFANCKNLLSTNKFSKAFILYTIWY